MIKFGFQGSIHEMEKMKYQIELYFQSHFSWTKLRKVVPDLIEMKRKKISSQDKTSCKRYHQHNLSIWKPF